MALAKRKMRGGISDQTRRGSTPTMKNTRQGFGGANEHPKKNGADVRPPEGVWGAGRSAPREGRRNGVPSMVGAMHQQDICITYCSRSAAEVFKYHVVRQLIENGRLSGLPIEAIPLEDCGRKAPAGVTRAPDL